MIGWWKKSEGFDWQKHIRTTVRLKRAERQRRLDGAKLAAAAGLRDAGRAGVVVGASGLALGRDWLMAGTGMARRGVSRLASLLAPVRRSSRAAAASVLTWAEARLRALPLPESRSMRLAILLSLSVALLGIMGGGGWLLWRGAAQVAGLAGVPGFSGRILDGRAVAVAGDRLRIGETIVRLAGIEAPERDQRCTRPGNRRWRCGEAAQEALARAVRGSSASCTLRGSDEDGSALGTCLVKARDVAEDLVREGHVFAAGGLFPKYAAQEQEARVERLGLWRGEAQRPAEHRARAAERREQAWEVAKRMAPSGCPIKGQVASGRKYYVVPGSADYERIRIRTRRGERWFCSEQEAQAAGWRPSPRS